MWREPTLFNFNAHEVVFADGKFALAGDGGWTGISTNGRDWKLQPHFDAGVLSELYFANGRWFASGYIQPGVSGVVTMTSTDGLHYSRVSDQRFTGVVYREGGYFAAAEAGVYKSTDGIGWEPVQTNDFGMIAMVLTADQSMVGLTFQGVLVHSADGTNWTDRLRSSAKFLTSYNGVLYAFGDDLLLASTNGLTWTAQPVTTPPWVLGGLFTGKAWIIYGQTQGLKPQFSHSFDQGKTWSVTDSPLNWRTFGMAYGNGRFVAVGTGVAVSEDGVQWENLSRGSSAVGGAISAMTHGNGVYVAAGGSPGRANIIWSTNAIQWVPAEVATTGSVYRLAHGPAGFVAGGNSGMLLHSPDGRAWSDVTVEKYRDEPHSIHALDVFDGKYYAISRTVLLVSENGRDWQDYPLSGVYYSITKIGNRFAIAGPDAGLRTSENLVDWSFVPNVTASFGVFSALGKAYALTYNGYVVSSDGVTWMANDELPFMPVAGFDRGILAVRLDDAPPYGGYPFGPYAAYSFSYSPDGVQWQKLGGPGRLQIPQTLYVNGRLFAVSQGGILEASRFGLLHLDRGADGQLKIFLESGVAAPRLQTSTDLETWTDTQLIPGGAIDGSSGQRFFRARLDGE